MRDFPYFYLSFFFAITGALVRADESVEPVKAIESLNLSTGGTGLYRPGKWGLIKVSLRNPNERAVELLATTHFLGDPALQYGRRLWMPPNSRISTWHPLKMPELDQRDQEFFDMRSMVISNSQGVESMTSNEFGAMQFDQSFRVAHDEPVTAMVVDVPDMDLPPQWIIPQDFVLTARYDRGLRHNFTLISDALFPAGEEVLDTLDHLVIASNRLTTDAAGIGAIRRWVASGGRLWIMADRVRPDLVRTLLGDEETFTEVDRVDLTTVHIENAPLINGSLTFDRELEKPASLVRIIGEDLEVHFEVNGWPAAFWKNYGEGRILVTTLGGDGWVRVRTRDDPKTPSGSNFETNFVPSNPLSQLAVHFFSTRTPPLIPQEVAEEEVQQLIGYVIPSRPFVLGTLLVFSCMILGTAFVTSRRGRMEWTGWAIPCLALVASGLLLFAGWSSRSTISASTAVIQTVQAVPGSNAIRTSGVAGVFAKEAQSSSMAGIEGGWMSPEMGGLELTTRRMVWTDLDEWRWENLDAKPGLRMVPFQTAGQVTDCLDAIGEFKDRAIEGKLTIPEGLDPADAIIATSLGRLGVELQRDGSFKADAEHILSEGQYLSASVLSDEQQRRSRMVAHAVAPFGEISRPTMPTLLVWTRPWEGGSSLNGPGTVGSALVSIPLRWSRPAPGTPVTIPSPFLPFREVMGPDGHAPSGLYDVRHHRWVERTGSVAAWLGFSVPDELIPVEVKSANIAIKVLGPVGRLELSTVVNGEPYSLKVWEAPVGTLTHVIDMPQALKLDSQGRFLIRVDAGTTDPAAPGKPGKAGPRRPTAADPVTFWQLEDVSVQLKAEVSPRL